MLVRKANREDPDQTASSEQSDLDLPCLSRLEKEASILIDYRWLDADLKEVFTINA